MNNDNIESLDDDLNTSTNLTNETPSTLGNVNDNSTTPNDPESLDAVSLDNAVRPTDLQKTNIDLFGQEQIPINNINQHPKPSSLQSVVKSDEYNNIGNVPPNAHIEPKVKKDMGKKKYIILAFILVVLIGVGIFFYLRLGRLGAIKLKKITIQVGEGISSNVSDFISSGKLDSSCVSNFDGVDINTVGEYEYKVICNRGTYIGKIIVADTSSPMILLKYPVKTVGEEITIDDFVTSCEDEASCSYKFVDEAAAKTLTNESGTYEVNISVSDVNNNSKTVTAYLVVVKESVNRILTCHTNSIENKDENLSYKISDVMGILSGDNGPIHDEITIREVAVKYNNKEAYAEAKKTIKEDNTIELSIASGKAYYNDQEKSIYIIKVMTSEELNKEFETYPIDYSELRNKYENDQRSFECDMEFKLQ